MIALLVFTGISFWLLWNGHYQIGAIGICATLCMYFFHSLWELFCGFFPSFRRIP
jgi:hypothetical protein